MDTPPDETPETQPGSDECGGFCPNDAFADMLDDIQKTPALLTQIDHSGRYPLESLSHWFFHGETLTMKWWTILQSVPQTHQPNLNLRGCTPVHVLWDRLADLSKDQKRAIAPIVCDILERLLSWGFTGEVECRLNMALMYGEGGDLFERILSSNKQPFSIFGPKMGWGVSGHRRVLKATAHGPSPHSVFESVLALSPRRARTLLNHPFVREMQAELLPQAGPYHEFVDWLEQGGGVLWGNRCLTAKILNLLTSNRLLNLQDMWRLTNRYQLPTAVLADLHAMIMPGISIAPMNHGKPFIQQSAPFRDHHWIALGRMVKGGFITFEDPLLACLFGLPDELIWDSLADLGDGPAALINPEIVKRELEDLAWLAGGVGTFHSVGEAHRGSPVKRGCRRGPTHRHHKKSAHHTRRILVHRHKPIKRNRRIPGIPGKNPEIAGMAGGRVRRRLAREMK